MSNAKLLEPEPQPDGSALVTYRLEGFQESGFHVAIRLLPAVAPLLERSRITASAMDEFAAIVLATLEAGERVRRHLADGLDIGDLAVIADLVALIARIQSMGRPR